ncbi:MULTISPECIES: hypothetical protein [Empedobacter]|uniref:Uncharacterized protein n=1 Tax=Empedobacter falsenii TaxID=343874 RepID=A0A3R8SUQ1_9FLAO|nr:MULTISPECIES: hypothetical protein [Empedobacter]HAD78608.1 hypothetical protein [Flavobacteriaceae bacterium]MDH0658698.1 hypothetical protein [Empedobacter sp. GD03865]MDH1601257.1 hypothetical protein [Empedobacter sp. GD03739]MDM1041000.1 hypothetical protein [Empedobacter brevis]MDM1134581.1 hypothetical protein [Empedobacter sp. R750]
MIKQDFISKYIQELNKTLARIISLEVGNADEGFLIIFNQMLQSYYKIDDNNLSTLLEANEERDQFLLADELKKKNILTFMKAIRIYLNREDIVKAKASYEVLKRIESINSGIFQFPTEEDNLIAQERKVVEEKMSNL